jgi:hypothetical protein
MTQMTAEQAHKIRTRLNVQCGLLRLPEEDQKKVFGIYLKLLTENLSGKSRDDISAKHVKILKIGNRKKGLLIKNRG